MRVLIIKRVKILSKFSQKSIKILSELKLSKNNIKSLSSLLNTLYGIHCERVREHVYCAHACVNERELYACITIPYDDYYCGINKLVIKFLVLFSFL